MQHGVGGQLGGVVRWKTPVVSMCNSDVRDVQNEGEAVQAGFFLYVLFQMENEQCGIARVFLGSPFVIVGSEYVANQPFGRLPLGRERDDLRGVRGDYMLCPLLHVIERVVVFSRMEEPVDEVVVHDEEAGVERFA